ncbi:MAG: ABC transporter permease subunit [Defluviitaleaceae bacterium]|nr:ABC transporter permease subunit [Defluviitaleaceae bacterium]
MSENKPKRESFASGLFKFLFTGRRAKDVSMWEEEQIESPGKTVMKEFFRRKMTIAGIIGFVTVFTLSMVLPFFFPVHDTDRDLAHLSIRPDLTMGMMRLPRELRGNVEMIAPGPGFSVGLSKDGNVYVWGSIAPETRDVFNVPEFSEPIVHVTAGRSHVVAVSENGRVYSWGHQHASTMHTVVPNEIQGRTRVVEAGLRTAVAILDDGSIQVFGGIDNNMANIAPFPAFVGSRANNPFSLPVGAVIAQVLASDNMAGVLTEDGELHIMSSNAQLRNVPDDVQGRIVDFAFNSRYVAVVLDNGSVYAWGQLPGLGEDEERIAINSGAVGIVDNDDDFVVAMAAGGFTRFDLTDNQLSAENNIPSSSLTRHSLEGISASQIVVNTNNFGILTEGSDVTGGGNVYVVSPSGHAVGNVPADIQGRIIDFALTDRNGAALLNDGTVVVWGEGPYQQAPAHFQGRVVSIDSGVTHFSVVLETGNTHTFTADPSAASHFWRLPVGVYVTKVEMNSNTAAVLTSDGEIYVLSPVDRTVRNVPQEFQGRFIDFALTDRNAAAILDDNTVVAWGDDMPARVVPEAIGARAMEINGGEAHFTVRLDDNSVYSWGDNGHRQSNHPNNNNIEEIFVGYHHNYALTSDGDVETWGLRGFPFGSDDSGRSMFSRVWQAGRYSLTIGFVAILIATFIGIILGSLAGYFGGWVETLIMRFGEIVMSLPFLPMALILNWRLQGEATTEVQNLMILMVVLGLISWPGIMRLVRAQVMQARNAEYVIGARALGVKEGKIISRHIMPNVLSVIIVQFALGLAGSMLTESTLSFLGFGITPPTPTWGNMLNAAQHSIVLRVEWWRWVAPAAALVTVVISINLIGDGLREAFDPRARGR